MAPDKFVEVRQGRLASIQLRQTSVRDFEVERRVGEETVYS